MDQTKFNYQQESLQPPPEEFLTENEQPQTKKHSPSIKFILLVLLVLSLTLAGVLLILSQSPNFNPSPSPTPTPLPSPTLTPNRQFTQELEAIKSLIEPADPTLVPLNPPPLDYKLSL